MFRKNQFRIKGFTLIEVLVVLSIIAVIVAFTIPAMAPALKGSKLRQSADQLEALLARAHQMDRTETSTSQYYSCCSMIVYYYDDDSRRVHF